MDIAGGVRNLHAWTVYEHLCALTYIPPNSTVSIKFQDQSNAQKPFAIGAFDLKYVRISNEGGN